MSAWIFGYGSLVWRPDFPYVERRTAAIDGWSRRFWQGSTDHRGVPGDPGRVVTLVREPGARCWGRAYRIGGRDGEAILEGLAFREKGGYDRIVLDLHFAGAPEAPAPGFVYFANPDNPNWLGPAPLADIARQVRRSRGPSGGQCRIRDGTRRCPARNGGRGRACLRPRRPRQRAGGALN